MRAFVSTFIPRRCGAAVAHNARCPRAVPPRARRVSRVCMQAVGQGAAAQGAVAGAFSWVEQWYPVVFEADFDASRPMPFKLWDDDLVMFREAGGDYVVFEDVCPHRAAPLSEGRVVQRDGATLLECGYHGWCFDCSGKCVDVPQAPADRRIPAAANLKKKYATAVRLGLVYVWYGRGAPDESLIPVPDVVAGYGQDMIVLREQTRVLPFDLTTLHENVLGMYLQSSRLTLFYVHDLSQKYVLTIRDTFGIGAAVLDPGHVPFAHHGSAIGNRSRASRDGRVEVLEHDFKGTGRMRVGVSPRSKVAKGGEYPSHISFRPPCLITITLKIPIIGELSIVSVGTPAGRGYCRLCFYNIVGHPTPLMRVWKAIAPRWLDHIQSNIVLDGDTALLRTQERTLQLRRPDGYGGAWKANYVLAANTWDSAVLAYRKWVDVNSASMPWRSQPVSPPSVDSMTRETVLDRYSSHVRDCPCCRGAMHVMQKLRIASLALSAASLVAMTSSLTVKILVAPAAVTVSILSGLAGGGALFLGLAHLLKRWIKHFTYSDVTYKLSHSD